MEPLHGAAKEDISAPAGWLEDGQIQFLSGAYSLRFCDSTHLSFSMAVPPGQGLGTLAHYIGVSRAVSVLWINRTFQSSVGAI